jgi:hypothetical protein
MSELTPACLTSDMQGNRRHQRAICVKSAVENKSGDTGWLVGPVLTLPMKENLSGGTSSRTWGDNAFRYSTGCGVALQWRLTCCGGDVAHIRDTVTLGVAGGGGGGSIGENGTWNFDTKMARRARASLRALDMGSVTNSLLVEKLRKTQRDQGVTLRAPE